jgi:hypothetical protein
MDRRGFLGFILAAPLASLLGQSAGVQIVRRGTVRVTTGRVFLDGFKVVIPRPHDLYGIAIDEQGRLTDCMVRRAIVAIMHDRGMTYPYEANFTVSNVVIS